MELAFQSDELDLEEWERAAANRQYQEIRRGILGRMPTASDLIELIRKNGPLSGYLESAWLLPLEEFWRVEEVHREEVSKRRSARWRPSR